MKSTNQNTSPVHREALDEAVLAYLRWREECSSVWDVYGRWASAAAGDKAPGHSAYSAALDREEVAANFYERLIKRVGDLFEAPITQQAQPNGRGIDEPRGAV